MNPALKYSNWLVTAILLFVGTRVLFVILRGVLTSDSFWRKTSRVPGAGNSCCTVYPCRGRNGSLESLGTVTGNCDLCLERICHHRFVAARSETQRYGLSFCAVLVLSGYLVPSA